MRVILIQFLGHANDELEIFLALIIMEKSAGLIKTKLMMLTRVLREMMGKK